MILAAVRPSGSIIVIALSQCQSGPPLSPVQASWPPKMLPLPWFGLVEVRSSKSMSAGLPVLFKSLYVEVDLRRQKDRVYIAADEVKRRVAHSSSEGHGFPNQGRYCVPSEHVNIWSFFFFFFLLLAVCDISFCS